MYLFIIVIKSCRNLILLLLFLWDDGGNHQPKNVAVRSSARRSSGGQRAFLAGEAAGISPPSVCACFSLYCAHVSSKI